MVSKWFRWEREASIHLIFPTLEVFFTSLRKYSEVSAPTMILVFEKDVVTWCIQEKEFIDYGKKLLEIYSEPSKETQMVMDIEKWLNELRKVEKDIEQTELSKISSTELANLHDNLYRAFISYYTMGAIGTPLSFITEIELKETGLSDEQINQLATPDEISYVSEAEDYLLRTKNIKGFVKQYFWIDNNYLGTREINPTDASERLANLESQNAAPQNHHKFVPNIDLNARQKRLVELLKNYSIYKDNRKKEILIYLHFMDLILKEIAGRRNLSENEIRASLPSEIEDIFKDNITKQDLQDRLEYCVVVWEENKVSPQILIGGKGKIWERKTLENTATSKLIQGRTACPGKVTGKVRILIKAEDCDQLKDGEVLVTFMTSPDFMSAIRRASAIVTNLGGVTSHAAIISRELNIPCIVGTKIAAQVLKTGDLVEVDATEGSIRIL